MRKFFTKPILLLNVVNWGVLLGGIGATVVAHDAHGLMRTGAFLAAVGGAFVVWQVREEMEMEQRNAEEEAKEAQQTPALTTLDIKAQQLKDTQRRRHGHAIRKARLAMVRAIAVWLFAGELLHGFGDILYHRAQQLLGPADAEPAASAPGASHHAASGQKPGGKDGGQEPARSSPQPVAAGGGKP